jgi:uncharacterized OsmC-like protein
MAMDYKWTARVRWVSDMQAAVYTRNNTFAVGQPASFRDRDPHPSAVELLLGALGGDLVNGMGASAKQQGLTIDNMELALSGTLANVLVTVGVIGETGDPHFTDISGTLYVSSDSDEAALQEAWAEALKRSPVANTLKYAATISIELRVAT